MKRTVTELVLRRIGSSLVLLLIASALIFVVLRMIPGDPTTLSARPGFGEEQRQARLEELGLNDPIFVQYFN